MGISRQILLRASQSRWLGRQFQKRAFAQRASRRFLPGEDLDSALKAAVTMQDRGIASLLTLLGENVTTPAAAEAVTRQYLAALAAIGDHGVDCQLSVKPTQLGLGLGGDVCAQQLGLLLTEAAKANDLVWLDMESSAYVDKTLDLVERAREHHDNVGVCVQVYLYRTKDDVERLIQLGVPIRLVKGAYREPANIAMQKKRDVDDNFLLLAERCLQATSAGEGGLPAFGTHDMKLIHRIQAAAGSIGLPKNAYEFEMLYGIGRENQHQIASEGYTMRILISYGADWFPWYMRRLAERPANVWFVVKSLFTG
jgi:proline dehydrogenase